MGLGALRLGLWLMDLHRFQAQDDERLDLANSRHIECPLGLVAVVKDGQDEGTHGVRLRNSP